MPTRFGIRQVHEQLIGIVVYLSSPACPCETRILELRFGLVDGHCYTLEEVGKKFGVTRERIRQMEAGALNRLRHPSRKRKLKGFL